MILFELIGMLVAALALFSGAAALVRYFVNHGTLSARREALEKYEEQLEDYEEHLERLAVIAGWKSKAQISLASLKAIRETREKLAKELASKFREITDQTIVPDAALSEEYMRLSKTISDLDRIFDQPNVDFRDMPSQRFSK